MEEGGDRLLHPLVDDLPCPVIHPICRRYHADLES
jgi:hypothetical protein